MRMTIGFLLLTILAGCHGPQRVVSPPGCDPVYSQYHLEQFQWAGVSRVLVLPFANESSYTRADEEIARAFRAELQQMGRFEVVAAPPDDIARLSEQIHRNGHFSEDAMIQLGKCFKADVVVHGTVTQYSPYPRPRVGITIQAVSPWEGKVVASVDGLWDSNHLPIAKRAQNYYLQRRDERTPYHEANWIYQDDGHADELALLSPQLYQRWVSSELAAILVQDPGTVGQVFAPRGTKAQTPARPPEPLNMTPIGPPMPVGQQPMPAGVKPVAGREPDIAPKTETRYNPRP
ncbi:hypothetical protein [Zavarzinella formosa]|uniref:hypothetical protein n=1 Tax=Zavarzinella formosa TaxID=360055 RepID=UPI0002E300E2|nr:hypothetical protein [Zavarzinella formosa]